LQKHSLRRPDAIFFYSQIADALKLYDAEGKLLQATLEKNPDPRLRIEAISQLGMNQYSRDKYIEAANTFRQMLAIQELPDNERVMTLYRLSVVEGRNENFENAIEAIQSAIRFAPQSPLLVNQLGLLQLQADQPEKAEVTLKSAIKLSEGDPKLESDSRILLGGLYSQLGRWKDAIATYTELLEMPELSQETARRGRMALSNAHVQNGDMVNGEKILQAVYALDPENPGVNNDLGYLYAEQNKNLEQAEKMIRIAVDAEPDNKAYLDSLGWVLYRRGKHEEAEKVLEKANSDPDYRDSTIIEHLGDVQQALKKSTQATETWQEALDEENKSDSPDKEIVKRLTDKIGSANAEPDR
jgi:Tfp pilus assembly protein PilF